MISIYNIVSKLMRKDLQTKIKMAQVLASIIGSRDVVDLLKSRILKSDTKSVVLDFKEVQFISRSAAHELLLIKEELRQKNKEFSFENMNPDVSKMLRIVAMNRAVPNTKQPDFNPQKADINSLQTEFSV